MMSRQVSNINKQEYEQWYAETFGYTVQDLADKFDIRCYPCKCGEEHYVDVDLPCPGWDMLHKDTALSRITENKDMDVKYWYVKYYGGNNDN